MTTIIARRPYQTEDDYWRIRRFLREVFLLNDRRERSWHVARLDYWRWHLIPNAHACAPVEEVTSLWETADGTIAAVLHPSSTGDIRLHVHPLFRSAELENEMLAFAEEHLAVEDGGARWVWLPVETGDELRRAVVSSRRFHEVPGMGNRWRRDLDGPIPEAPVAPGYTVRSMGDRDEHPARSWASWRAFHSDEPVGAYDGDWSWFRGLQSAPLYRRDLDIVAVAPGGEIASFCTMYYDDYTRSAVCVLVGTAVEHQRRGLGKAVILEGMRRLRELGGTRVFATAHDAPADALYGSVMQAHDVAKTWAKQCRLSDCMIA